jgi:hypothetical protein
MSGMRADEFWKLILSDDQAEIARLELTSAPCNATPRNPIRKTPQGHGADRAADKLDLEKVPTKKMSKPGFAP